MYQRREPAQHRERGEGRPQRIDIPREMRRIDEFVETLKRDGFTIPTDQ